MIDVERNRYFPIGSKNKCDTPNDFEGIINRPISKIPHLPRNPFSYYLRSLSYNSCDPTFCYSQSFSMCNLRFVSQSPISNNVKMFTKLNHFDNTMIFGTSTGQLL